jgi:ketosteroid isomerase-like protein
MLNVNPATANVALVKGLYEAFARGDIPAILAASAPDIDWNPIGPAEEIPLFKRRRGVDEVAAFFGDVAAAYDFSEFTPLGFYGVEDKVFVPGRYQMTVKKTGRAIDSEWVMIYTIRDGKIVSMREHTDTAQFIKAFG